MAEEKRSGPLYKIVLAGDVGVGKTSIFQRYDKDKFYDHKNPTFGMDSLTRDVMVDGKRICQINVWDTAGLEKTRSLTSNYYRNAHAVIFVYAIDDMYTLNALKGWVTDVDTDAKTALKFLVGNKTDLADEGFQVDKQQAESFRKNNGLHSVYEVSAKTGTGVKEMFENIGKLLVQSKTGAVQKKDAFAVIDTENENGSEKTSSGCCG